ncbi:MAG: hypothetical protein ABI546_05315 [Polaromonas sp.]
MLPKRLHIGVSPAGITLLRTRKGFTSEAVVLADAALPQGSTASPDTVAEQLRTLLAQTNCRGLVTTIVLADPLVRVFMVTPPRNPTRLQDCQAAAAMRFQTLYDTPLADWHLSADWNANQPFVACAVPRSLLDSLKQASGEHRLALIEISPHFVVAWNRWRARLAPGDWFGVMHDGTLTLGVTKHRRLAAVRAAAVPTPALMDTRWLSGHLMREALRLDVPPPPRLQLCGSAPNQWVMSTEESLKCVWLSPQAHDLGRPSVPSGVALASAGFQ